jgi:hypothetical protein
VQVWLGCLSHVDLISLGKPANETVFDPGYLATGQFTDQAGQQMLGRDLLKGNECFFRQRRHGDILSSNGPTSLDESL